MTSAPPLLSSLIKRVGAQLTGLGISAAAPPLVALLLLPIFTYHVTPEEFGVWALLQVAGLIFGVFGSFGILAAIPFYYTEEDDADLRAKKVGNILIWASLINGLILALMLLFGAPLFHLLFPSVPFHPLIVLTLVQGALSPYIDTPVVAWKMKEKTGRVAAITLVRVVAVGAAQLYLVVAAGEGLYGLVAGGVAGSAVAALFALATIRGEVAFWIDAHELKKGLKLGAPSMPTAMFANIYRFADRIILERFVGHDVIGLYYLALRFGDLLKMGMDMLTQAFTPVFYKEAQNEAGRPMLARLAAILSAVFAVGALVTAVGGEAFVALTMAPRFHDAIFFLPFAVAAPLLKGNYAFPHLSVWLSKKSYYFPAITVAPMIVSVALNLWLIPLYGAYAAGGVMMAAFALHAGLTYVVGQRVMPMPYRYGAMAGVTGLAVALLFAGSPWGSDLPLPFRGGMALLLMVGASWLTVAPLLKEKTT
jgi:O-antigen/teichoic acid export membrane protein